MCVNVRTGTAALISNAYPGSVHDIVILRGHADELNEVLGDKTMLADLGYIGSQRDVPGVVVCGDDNYALRRRRVLVECLFGRLKCLWSIFSSKWRVDEKYFDRFFNVACALTNIDIFYRPLRDEDRDYNIGVLNLILFEMETCVENQKRASEKYRQRRERVLNGLDSEGSETLDEGLLIE